MDSSKMQSSTMESTNAPSGATEKSQYEENVKRVAIGCCILLLLVPLLYLAVSNLTGTDSSGDNSDRATVDPQYVAAKPTTKSTTTTTTYRPRNPNYKQKNITGLLCHTAAPQYLAAELPPACDFFIADVDFTASKHQKYHPYMANVQLKPASQKDDMKKRMAKAPGKGLILMVSRQSVRSQNAIRVQAVVRGMLQIVTELNADGVGLNEGELLETSMADVKADAAILSDELRTYHGLYRHNTYKGSTQAFKGLIAKVASLPSIVFVYRVTGRTAIFTAPYVHNFYTKRFQVETINTHVKRDVVEAFPTTPGRKAVAISFALQSRNCPNHTVRGIVQMPQCKHQDLNMTKICNLHPRRLQAHFDSVMTRRDEEEEVGEDVFFELQGTLSRKAKLVLQQLKNAGLAPITLIIERYHIDVTKKIPVYEKEHDKTTDCPATMFGFTERAKDLIKGLV